MDVLEYEGDSEVDAACWAALDLDADHRAQIEFLRPPRPFWISTTDVVALNRWALCWRVAAAAAIVLGGYDDERTQRMFAWSASRGLFHSDIPTFNEQERLCASAK